MDIESFYEQNEKRRESTEVEFGTEWSDASGNHYELSWVEATGEVILMLEPDARISEDAFGDFSVSGEIASAMEVLIIATVTTLDDVEGRLTGWEEAMAEPNSLAWLSGRFPRA